MTPIADDVILEQDSELMDLFEHRPEDAESRMQDMLRRRDPQIERFLGAIPIERKCSEPERKALCIGFPVCALLEILCDQSWYTGMETSQLAITTQDEDELLSNEWIIGRSIICLANLTNMFVKEPKVVSTKREADLYDGLPGLWKLLWRYREKVFSSTFMPTVEAGLLPHVGALCANSVPFSPLYRPLMKPSWDTYTGHIAFYAWARLPVKGSCRCPCNPRRRLVGLVVALYFAAVKTNTEWQSFIQEALLGSLGPDRLDSLVWRVLVKDHHLHGEALGDTIELLAVVCGLCSYMHDVLHCKAFLKNILFAMATAGQRQSCLGGPTKHSRETGNSDYAIGRRIIAMLQPLLAHKGAIAQARKHIRRYIADLHFIPSIAQSMVPAFQTEQHNATEPAKFLIDILVGFGRQARVALHLDTQTTLNYQYLCRILRMWWFYTLDHIEEASLMLQNEDPHNWRAKESLADGLRLWMKLRGAFGLDKNSVPPTTKLIDDAYSQLLPVGARFYGCAWINCLCYGRRTLHGNMRVCTGCWSAVYCSRWCQRMD